LARYRDTVFAATHNSYAGDARGDLDAQLRAGVRGFELDVVRHGAGLLIGHGLPGLEVSRDGANPNDDRLESWLRRLARWRGRGPLTIVLDLKNKLTSEAGPGSVTALLDLLDEVFGRRLVPADDPAVLDVDAAGLDGRVFAVASGSRRTRERLRRDPGRDPILAADARGRLLEVHAAPRGRGLWWWSGATDGDGLSWDAHGRLPRAGRFPCLAMAPDGFFAVVTTPDGDRRADGQLMVRTGRLDARGRPVFHRARRLGWGRDAHLAWRNGAFHARFTAAATGDAVHRRGLPVADGTALQWVPAGADGPAPGHDPARARLPDGTMAEVDVDPDGHLRWRRDDGPWRPLRYRPLAWVERQPGDPVRLQRDGLEFCAAPARSRAWGAARKAEGRVVRLWQVTESARPATPVNFPATDTPFAAWYLRYLREAGGPSVEDGPPSIV